MTSAYEKSEPTKLSPLLLDTSLLTFFNAGRYIQISSSPSECSIIKLDVPLTSAGEINLISLILSMPFFCSFETPVDFLSLFCPLSFISVIALSDFESLTLLTKKFFVIISFGDKSSPKDTPIKPKTTAIPKPAILNLFINTSILILPSPKPYSNRGEGTIALLLRLPLPFGERIDVRGIVLTPLS